MSSESDKKCECGLDDPAYCVSQEAYCSHPSLHSHEVAPKIVCHAEGDRCLGCDHYNGKAPVCIYAPQSASVPMEETEDAIGDWQCKDFGDSWITFPTRKAAEKYQKDTGALMRYRRYYYATTDGTGEKT